MYFSAGFDESSYYEALPDEGWKYYKWVAARAYRLGHDYSYDEFGFIPKSMEKKLIEEGANCKLVMQTDTAFHSDYALEVRRRWGYDPFRISKNTADVYAFNSGIPIQKDSCLFEVFNQQVWFMRSGGIPDHFMGKIDIEEQLDEPLEPIDMRHVLVGLGMYFIGLLMALLAFLYEVFLKGTFCNSKTTLAKTSNIQAWLTT